MKFQGFIGPTYQLDSVNVDAQRCVNLIPEIIESGTGKEGQQMFYRGTPGLEKIFELGPGPIRLVHFASPPVDPLNKPTRVMVVSGKKLFRLEYDGADWTTTEIRLFIGETDFDAFNDGDGISPIIAVSTSNDLGNTIFVDGSAPSGTCIRRYYRQNIADVAYENFEVVFYGVFPFFIDWASTHVAYIDGYLIYNSRDANQFYVSDWNTYSVNPMSFASSEGDPDVIMGLIAIKRYLWIFNERTTEVYSNNGNADFPFERIGGGFIEKGCVARYSIAKIDEKPFLLGRDESGEGIVLMGQGLNLERISTHAMEQAIKRYADISKAVAYTYQDGGHQYYVLNFDEATWTYDLKSGLWHERCYTNEGILERHRGNFHAFIPTLRKHFIGDYANSKIYQSNDEYCTDDGTEITRMRVCPHISSEGEMLQCAEFNLDMETGVGLDGDGLGSDPQVMLDFSDDGGHTWKGEAWASAGKKIGGIGEFKKRVTWRRLGRFRDRVFRIKITDPVKTVLLGANLKISGGR